MCLAHCSFISWWTTHATSHQGIQCQMLKHLWISVIACLATFITSLLASYASFSACFNALNVFFLACFDAFRTSFPTCLGTFKASFTTLAICLFISLAALYASLARWAYFLSTNAALFCTQWAFFSVALSSSLCLSAFITSIRWTNSSTTTI